MRTNGRETAGYRRDRLRPDPEIRPQLLIIEHRLGRRLAAASDTAMPTTNADRHRDDGRVAQREHGAGYWSTSTQTVGLMTISSTDGTAPDRIDATAPAVLNRRHTIEINSGGKIGAARDGERQSHHERDVLPLEQLSPAARPRCRRPRSRRGRPAPAPARSRARLSITWT